MPGVLLEVVVAPGDRVSRGQVVAVLEAMKMRNEIKAPRDGVVAAIFVQPGQLVAYGDPLVRVEEA
jgi:biotin carboxyl carrier protein